MTTTKIEQIKAAKRANRDHWAAQTVTVDENWRIIRSDELNWEIQYKARDKTEWRFFGFFPTISSAIRAIPAKMLGEVAKGTLNDVLRSQEAIIATIEKALP